MASDSWSRFPTSSSSRRYHLHQSRSDLYEDAVVEEDSKAEFLCPFCAEDFDFVGLCCHIDEEHPVEAKNGVCPVCAKRVGLDIVGHVTRQHANFFKVQRKRRLRKAGSNSNFSMLRKELRDGSLQSLLGESCFLPSNTEPDPLLSSFMFNPPGLDESLSNPPVFSVEESPAEASTNEEFLESDRKIEEPRLSDKDQEERSRKCEFVQGLLLSTILDDEL